MKTRRLSLRALAVATAAVGAALLPAGAAFADSSPTAVPAVEKPVDKSTARPAENPAEFPVRELGDQKGKPSGPMVRVPVGGVAAGDKPVVAKERKPAAAPMAVKPGKADKGDKAAPVVVAPRGGVAAGEQTAASTSTSTNGSGNGTAALAGTAVAFALVAGAGTFVVRRRATLG
ncbi:hypothetical protein [Streptomyces sp. NPDC001985]|uniref:hypothetical protein n=1 Tax=Streptomyces sp. NPDC001985 TaxID=3154406 RepID=UPI003316F5B3